MARRACVLRPRRAGFQPDDFDASVRRIRDADAEVVTDVHLNSNAGHREIWIRDLDGYLVVLAEVPCH